MGRDGWTGLAILAASLFLFGATLGLERNPLVPVGPDFYPRLVLGVTAAMALLLVAIDVAARRKLRLAAAPPAPPPERRNYALVLISFAIFAAYVIALPWLGFRVATLVFVVALQAVLDKPRSPRRWATVAIVAAATMLATYYVFESYLQVLLPRGRWTGF
jgi:hypothetical protein